MSLATLAHELPNPLAPIRAGLELMSLAKDEPESVEDTRCMIERQTKSTLVDDLLDISRITRGKLDMRKYNIKLNDVIQTVIESSQPHIDEAGHELTVKMPESPPHATARMPSGVETDLLC